MNKNIKSNKRAEISDITIGIILVIVLMIIGLVIVFSKANTFKALLG